MGKKLKKNECNIIQMAILHFYPINISTMKKISFKNTLLPYPSENLELLTQNYPKPPSNLVHR